MNSLIAGACTKGCQDPLLHTLRRYGAKGAASQGPPHKFSATAVLSRRSRTGDNCSRLITFDLQLRCSNFVLFHTVLEVAKFSIAVYRYMYLYCAIDEAGSHVGSKSFRLVVGVYSQTGEDLLGSACSQPIRVMANNDVPHGAALIPLIVHVRCCCLQTC